MPTLQAAEFLWAGIHAPIHYTFLSCIGASSFSWNIFISKSCISFFMFVSNSFYNTFVSSRISLFYFYRSSFPCVLSQGFLLLPLSFFLGIGLDTVS